MIACSPHVRSAMCAGLFAVGSADAQGNPRTCGVERWPVKIAVDVDAARIDPTIRQSSIHELGLLPRPEHFPQGSRASEYELRTFRVVGVVLATIGEGDGDIHLVIGDPDDHSATMIVEVPDSACALGSGRAREYANAYRELTNVQIGAVVRIDGIGFFDRRHNQIGAAPNYFELHPVIAARVLSATMAGQRRDSTAKR